MAPYDSDEDNDNDSLASGLEETTVLLGYASKDPGTDLISHLGGRPVGISTPVSLLYAYCSLFVSGMVRCLLSPLGSPCKMQVLLLAHVSYPPIEL